MHLGGFQESIQAFRQEGGHGCNVTLPFKFEAAAFATDPTPRAELAQACNTLRFDDGVVFGDNTDGVGLVTDIVVNAGVPLEGRDLLLIGAGGAAAGVLGPLIAAKPRRILVANRTPERAAILIGRHTVLARRHAVKVTAARPRHRRRSVRRRDQRHGQQPAPAPPSRCTATCSSPAPWLAT